MNRRAGLGLIASLLTLALSATVHADPAVQRIDLDGKAGGKRFDGIGVVDGGGATSVFLKDYPEPQRGQILDWVFKPKFGASVSALYVEVPGDGNSTQGSMPSHMHSRDDLNPWRGYIWWDMTEARKRNPALSLDGAAWSAPGWVGRQGAVFDKPAAEGDGVFFSQDTIDYYLAWLKGLHDQHHLDMDAIGIRNEKGTNYAFAEAFRKALDAHGFQAVKLHGFDNWPDDWKLNFVKDMASDPALRGAIDVVSAHNNPPDSVAPADIRQLADQMGKPMWNTEQHVYKPGFDGLISTVQSFNDNYIQSGYTKITDWYGIAALYTMEPYSGVNEAIVRANWPWSGHYELNEKLWAYAHYGQFTQIGWTYLKGGSGKLDGGGTYVTLKSPQSDYSLIIETKDATAPQTVRLSISHGLSPRALAVWRSNEAEQFVRQPDLKPVKGAVTLTLDPRSVYSLTTTRGQQKGRIDAIPDRTPFPFPYFETFEEYRNPRDWGYLPRYFADISGAFELAPCPGRDGICLHQAETAPPISWGPDWQPYTIVGDDQWRDYAVAADLYLGAGETAGVMGRVNNVGTGYGIIPKGYLLELSAGGDVTLKVVRGRIDKKKAVGDAEQQALIKASDDDSAGGEKVLATAKVPGMTANSWHHISLQFNGATITGQVDGVTVVTATNTLYGSGMAGLAARIDGQTVSQPWFDNLSITAPGGATPAPAAAQPGQAPIYAGAR